MWVATNFRTNCACAVCANMMAQHTATKRSTLQPCLCPPQHGRSACTDLTLPRPALQQAVKLRQGGRKQATTHRKQHLKQCVAIAREVKLGALQDLCAARLVTSRVSHPTLYVRAVVH